MLLPIQRAPLKEGIPNKYNTDNMTYLEWSLTKSFTILCDLLTAQFYVLDIAFSRLLIKPLPGDVANVRFLGLTW